MLPGKIFFSICGLPASGRGCLLLVEAGCFRSRLVASGRGWLLQASPPEADVFSRFSLKSAGYITDNLELKLFIRK